MPKVHYRVAAQRRLRHAAGDAFVSALLTRSSRRRLNGFSGVSQYRVEDGPPPLLQRSGPKVPVDYSLVDGLSLVVGFHTSKSLCARGTCYVAPNICWSPPLMAGFTGACAEGSRLPLPWDLGPGTGDPGSWDGTSH